jgi:hypothetical protein
MTKPEGISQSAWDEAGSIHSRRSYRELIARAIMAATERAALIAENHNAWPQEGADIAAAIRQGSQPSNAIPVRGMVR